MLQDLTCAAKAAFHAWKSVYESMLLCWVQTVVVQRFHDMVGHPVNAQACCW